jgi:hypothetical protein
MLPTPTVELVEEECRKYDENPSNQVGDLALKELRVQFPRNTVTSHVLLKVLVLNALYHTRVRDIDTETLARHIAEGEPAIDSLLDQGKLAAVERIFVSPNLHIKYYSFATKYCSWHKPETYPIYDRYAVKCLWSYNKQEKFRKFSLEDLRYYDKFVATVTAFRDRYNLNCLTFRQIDKFLWRSGDRILRGLS